MTDREQKSGQQLGFDNVISEEGLMKLLGVSKLTLQNLREYKGLPHIPVERGINVYLEPDVTAWLQSQRVISSTAN